MKYTVNEFYCTCCGKKGIPIWRKRGAEREAGHLKKIFCLKCGKTVNHAECKPFSKYSYEDFLLEFENDNFDEEGNRKLPYGIFKDKMRKEGVI